MIVPLVLVASVGVVACGGGDKKLAKADLAKKANAICTTAQTAARKIPAPTNLTQDPVAAAAYFSKIAPITQKETDDLAKLKPKDDAKTNWNQFVARQKQANETLKTLEAKAKAKDRSGLQDLAKAQRIGTKLASEATAVGATTCAAG